MTNRVVAKITQAEISDVTAATGQAKMITNFLNEAQSSLGMDDWYTLLTTRTVATVASTATVAFASDFARGLDVTDTTSGRVLVEDTVRTFDLIDRGQGNTGTPTHMGYLGTAYIFHPTPAAVLSLRDRYWKIPTPMAANGDFSSFPDFCDNIIMYYAEWNILEYLHEVDKADRARIRMERELKSAKTANRKVINQMHVMRDVTPTRNRIGPLLPTSFGIR